LRRPGIHITDSTGKRYLDASGGAAISCFGHGHPRITTASAARSRGSCISFVDMDFALG